MAAAGMPPPQQPGSRNDFRIAIVCAFKNESTAVMAMFDEHWDVSTLGRLPKDANEYSIGRIGSHNIVLAYLPGMGTNSAAASINSLIAAYTSIELALLVGVCGGAPNSDDDEIILGDVVVSDSIVQYDYGSKYPHALVRKDAIGDCLPRHRPRIRSFLHRIQTLQGKSELEQRMRWHLERMLDQSAFTAWSRPPHSTDRLFDTRYRHKHRRLGVCAVCDSCEGDRDETCKEALKAPCVELGCSDEHSTLRDRVKTAIEQDTHLQPKVSFGTVASGNQIMKSAIDRDAISRRENAIAFEMEGAGLWDYAPTLIVKSVCDYADTHKNKDWQKYACAAAASCMKALLQEWKGADSMGQPLSGHEQTLHTVNSAAARQQDRDQANKVIDALWFREIADRFDGVEEAQFESFQWIFDEDKNPLLKFTSTQEAWYFWDYDYPGSSLLLKYTEKFQRGTIIEWDPCGIQTWLRDGEGIFWVTGKPGCGKSTLMKFIYENDQYKHLLSNWASGCTLIIPAFFSWRAGSDMQNSLLGLLQSIIYQSLKSHPELVPRVLEAVERDDLLHLNQANQGSMASVWTLQRVQRIFKKLVSLHEVKICILIDGLDEMSVKYTDVADFLKKSAQNRNVKILVSGRFLSEFTGSFHGCTTIHLHEWTLHDMVAYVKGRLLDNKNLRDQAEVSHEDFEQLIQNLLRKAEGVFIWIKTAVSTLIDGIYKCDTLKELQERLEELPSELYDLYETIVLSLDRRYASQSRLYLSLLVSPNRRSFGSDAATFSIAAQYDQDALDWVLRESSRNDATLNILQASTKRRLESRCAQFVSFHNARNTDDFNWTVDFMHRTVADFLESPKIQAWLTEGCQDTDFYDIAISMGAFVSEVTGLEKPRWCDFLSIVNRCDLDFTGVDDPITGSAVRAIKQLAMAAFEWFGDDSELPMDSLIDLDRFNWAINSETCRNLGLFPLVEIWSKYRNSQRTVAFVCLMLYGNLAGTARKYLNTNPCELTTENRVDMLTIDIFSNDMFDSVSNLIEVFCSQDPACAELCWKRIILMLNCQSNVSPRSYRNPYEKFFTSRFIAAVEALLRLGVNPNVLVQCSLAASQHVVLQSPLCVFLRCLAFAQTMGTVIENNYGVFTDEIHLEQIRSVIRTVQKYGAVDLEVPAPESDPQREEILLTESLTKWRLLRNERVEKELSSTHIVAEDVYEQEELVQAVHAEEWPNEEQQLDLDLEEEQEEIFTKRQEEQALHQQHEEDEEAFLEHYAGICNEEIGKKRKREEQD